MHKARVLGGVWGVAGVMIILISAVWRLAPHAAEIFDARLTAMQIIILLAWCTYMLISEGYQGFQQRFAPRVAARAQYLAQHGSKTQLVLAPLFCMGYFHSTKKRLIVSYGITIAIVLFIIVVRMLPIPIRSIIDAGVVLGLSYGIIWIAFYGVKALKNTIYLADPPIVAKSQSATRPHIKAAARKSA